VERGHGIDVCPFQSKAGGKGASASLLARAMFFLLKAAEYSLIFDLSVTKSWRRMTILIECASHWICCFYKLVLPLIVPND
jgi:hypothetical protein